MPRVSKAAGNHVSSLPLGPLSVRGPASLFDKLPGAPLHGAWGELRNLRAFLEPRLRGRQSHKARGTSGSRGGGFGIGHVLINLPRPRPRKQSLKQSSRWEAHASESNNNNQKLDFAKPPFKQLRRRQPSDICRPGSTALSHLKNSPTCATSSGKASNFCSGRKKAPRTRRIVHP